MFEGIILIVFFIVGILTTLLAIFFIATGLFKKSKTMFKLGLIITIIPVLFYSLTFWFYEIQIPKLNKQEESRYIGTYLKSATGNEKNIKLLLNADGTFQLDQNSFTNFYGKGTWKAGATDDGQFEFRNSNNFIVFWAMPSNNNTLEIDDDFNDNQDIMFIKETVAN